MQTFFMEGGFPMWAVLVFGLVALGAAGHFAWRPEHRKLGFIGGMAAATLFTSLMGVAADLAKVGHAVAVHWDEWRADVERILLQGLAESLAPAILGFTFLSLVGVLCAVGWNRSTAGHRAS
jgi:hypothetical protein